jgi:hypothetical protein
VIVGVNVFSKFLVLISVFVAAAVFDSVYVAETALTQELFLELVPAAAVFFLEL